MITLAQLTELFGWAALINIAYLSLATLLLVLMKGTISSLHCKMFNLERSDLEAKYFAFLSHYKVLTLVFFVAPYIALKIMRY
ncbi:DUF6868 family protein [Catenovulum sediminis]|uniref:DUF6868 family protein n=1 Tax=Catenovulum sediminis TaxID=1740262 RepID=A0ABV1RE55_9ALTE|nr:hypothetical protein [Catenovulum sediminis]